MSKILKLTGLASYISAVTNGVVLKRGQTARVDDDVSDTWLGGSRKDKEGEPVPYFTEQADNIKPDFDFTGSTKKSAKTAKKPTDEDEGDEETEVRVTPRKPSRQRSVSATA